MHPNYVKSYEHYIFHEVLDGTRDTRKAVRGATKVEQLIQNASNGPGKQLFGW